MSNHKITLHPKDLLLEKSKDFSEISCACAKDTRHSEIVLFMAISFKVFKTKKKNKKRFYYIIQ